MRIQGVLRFNDKLKHNQVTLEGAKSIVDSLINNKMGYITNILFITDEQLLNSLLQAPSVNETLMEISWEDVNNLPGYGKVYSDVCYGYVSSSRLDPSDGCIVISEQSGDASITIRCNCYFDKGTVNPQFDGTPVLAMILVLNGSGLPNQTGQYNPTGNERILSFVQVPGGLQIASTEDTSFTWDITVSVVQ